MLVTAAAFPLAVARAREGGMAEGQAQLVRNGILLLAVAPLPAAYGRSPRRWSSGLSPRLSVR